MKKYMECIANNFRKENCAYGIGFSYPNYQSAQQDDETALGEHAHTYMINDAGH